MISTLNSTVATAGAAAGAAVTAAIATAAAAATAALDANFSKFLTNASRYVTAYSDTELENVSIAIIRDSVNRLIDTIPQRFDSPPRELDWEATKKRIASQITRYDPPPTQDTINCVTYYAYAYLEELVQQDPTLKTKLQQSMGSYSDRLDAILSPECTPDALKPLLPWYGTRDYQPIHEMLMAQLLSTSPSAPTTACAPHDVDCSVIKAAHLEKSRVFLSSMPEMSQADHTIYINFVIDQYALYLEDLTPTQKTTLMSHYPPDCLESTTPPPATPDPATQFTQALMAHRDTLQTYATTHQLTPPELAEALTSLLFPSENPTSTPAAPSTTPALTTALDHLKLLIDTHALTSSQVLAALQSPLPQDAPTSTPAAVITAWLKMPSISPPPNSTMQGMGVNATVAAAGMVTTVAAEFISDAITKVMGTTQGDGSSPTSDTLPPWYFALWVTAGLGLAGSAIYHIWTGGRHATPDEQDRMAVV